MDNKAIDSIENRTLEHLAKKADKQGNGDGTINLKVEKDYLTKQIQDALTGGNAGFTAEEANEIFGLELTQKDDESTDTESQSTAGATISTDFNRALYAGKDWASYNKLDNLSDEQKKACKDTFNNIKEQDVAAFIKGGNMNSSSILGHTGFLEDISKNSDKTGITFGEVEKFMAKFLSQAKKLGKENEKEYQIINTYYESFLKNISAQDKKLPFKDLGATGTEKFFGVNTLDDIDEYISTLIQKMEGKNGIERLWDDVTNPQATNSNQITTIAGCAATGAAIGCCFAAPWLGAAIGAGVGVVLRWF